MAMVSKTVLMYSLISESCPISSAAAASILCLIASALYLRSSNILVGLLSLPPIAPSTGYVYKRNLSHEALVLALVRGRPLATKALVASSPLWQPLDDFNEDGWDCQSRLSCFAGRWLCG